MKFYTGIGSRETPEGVLRLMKNIGYSLGLSGYCLRSGNAGGADTYFYQGQSKVSSEYEIFLPWPKFGEEKNDKFIPLDDIDDKLVQKAINIVTEIHPAWNKCSQAAKKMHARNAFQVLGKDLNTPSEVVICWTQGGKAVGGTATAINLAKEHDIPVWNLGGYSEC